MADIVGRVLGKLFSPVPAVLASLGLWGGGSNGKKKFTNSGSNPSGRSGLDQLMGRLCHDYAPTKERHLVIPGVEVLARNNFGCLAGKKVGLITNHTGLMNSLEHEVDVMVRSGVVDLVAIFASEHGFRGNMQAGKSGGTPRDEQTGLPIYDIHQKRGAGLRALFVNAGVDTIVFDIQDVGARFYTYVWSLYDSMVAIAAHGNSSTSKSPVTFVVLDRPNPVGGDICEGPLLQEYFSSLVGRKGIPIRHGMTVGELAMLFNSEFLPRDCGGLQVKLEVVAMEGWHRRMLWPDTGLIWVPPSPNLPTFDVALLYNGLALIEGTNVSEGRGTTLPFVTFGAPYIDGKLADVLRKGNMPGVAVRQVGFTPNFSKYEKHDVQGVQIHVTEASLVSPLHIALSVIIAIATLYPKHFQWQTPSFGGSKHFVDLLYGSPALRDAVARGMSVDEIVASWQEDLAWFRTVRNNYLLYM
eukprot:jgi/Mesvir1/14296/Mv09722-RA.1